MILRTSALTIALMFPLMPLASAGDRVSAWEAREIGRALKYSGCWGGRYERERRYYEVDDARCHNGREYELKLDWNFRIISKRRD